MSPVVVFIGRIILIPSWLGIALGVLVAAVSITDPKVASDGGNVIGTIVGGGLVLGSIVGDLLGWLLTMKTNVLKCTHRVCGSSCRGSAWGF